MPALNTHGWVDVHLRAIDTHVVVRIGGSDRDQLADAMRGAWTRCLHEPNGAQPAAEVKVVLDGDPEVVRRATTDGILASGHKGLLLDAISSHVTTSAITVQAGSMLMLHAGAVAEPDTGRTVVLVGPSGAGKTTAAQVLGQTFGYVTDETVGVHRDGTVVAYPKPLSLKQPGDSFKAQVSPDVVGLLTAAPRLHLHRILLLRRGAAGPPRLEPLPVMEALVALSAETSYLKHCERPLHLMAALLESSGGLAELHYDQADALPDVVADLLASAG